ncbi:MAG: hypothetical protein H7Z77_08725 [Chitinophagaceae bacterium]|nr:hypothetical protein [Polaromonas sp.]
MIGLLSVMVVVGTLLKKQWSSNLTTPIAVSAPDASPSPAGGAAKLPSSLANAPDNMLQQAEHIQQQYMQAIDAAIKARPEGDEK